MALFLRRRYSRNDGMRLDWGCGGAQFLRDPLGPGGEILLFVLVVAASGNRWEDEKRRDRRRHTLIQWWWARLWQMDHTKKYPLLMFRRGFLYIEFRSSTTRKEATQSLTQHRWFSGSKCSPPPSTPSTSEICLPYLLPRNGRLRKSHHPLPITTPIII